MIFSQNKILLCHSLAKPHSKFASKFGFDENKSKNFITISVHGDI